MKEIHVGKGAARATPAALASVALALGAMMSAAPAMAQQNARAAPPPVASFVGSPVGAMTGANVQRYQDTTGRMFTLDRSGDVPLLKFDDSPEIFALRATSIQRGDDLLRNDVGQQILRITELGNIIAYANDADGAPADMVGRATPLSAAPSMPAPLTSRVKAVADRLSKIVGHDVTVFGAGDFSNKPEWASEALTMTVRGFERTAQVNAKAVKKVLSVRMMRASQPRVDFIDGELVLSVNPDDGYAGRPSSEMISNRIITGK